jgi:hypothetical protein
MLYDNKRTERNIKLIFLHVDLSVRADRTESIGAGKGGDGLSSKSMVMMRSALGSHITTKQYYFTIVDFKIIYNPLSNNREFFLEWAIRLFAIPEPQGTKANNVRTQILVVVGLGYRSYMLDNKAKDGARSISCQGNYQLPAVNTHTQE